MSDGENDLLSEGDGAGAEIGVSGDAAEAFGDTQSTASAVPSAPDVGEVGSALATDVPAADPAVKVPDVAVTVAPGASTAQPADPATAEEIAPKPRRTRLRAGAVQSTAGASPEIQTDDDVDEDTLEALPNVYIVCSGRSVAVGPRSVEEGDPVTIDDADEAQELIDAGFIRKPNQGAIIPAAGGGSGNDAAFTVHTGSGAYVVCTGRSLTIGKETKSAGDPVDIEDPDEAQELIDAGFIRRLAA